MTDLGKSDPLALNQENFDWALRRIGDLTERCEHLADEKESIKALAATAVQSADARIRELEGR